jgi:hypothetical protein
MTEHPLDAIALTIEVLAVADGCFTVRFRRDNGLDPTLLQIASDRISVVGLVGEKGTRRLFGQINQRLVGFTIRRFAGGEVEGDRTASGITDTMNFTGEPAPRAAKSALMTPPFPPAAETWARTVVLSML